MFLTKILKILLLILGGFFIATGITFLIFSFLLHYGFANLSDLQDNFNETFISYISSEKVKSDLMQNPQIQQLQESCKSNPDTEECLALKQLIDNPDKALQNPEIKATLSQFNEQMSLIVSSIKPYETSIFYIRFFSIFAILLGTAFIYLTNFSIVKTLYFASIKSAITAWIAVLYYTFLPRYLTTDLLSSVVDSSLPEGLVNEFVSTILTFMSITFHSTMFVALTLAIIFSIMVFIFYIIQRKTLNNEENSKQDGRKLSKTV